MEKNLGWGENWSWIFFMRKYLVGKTFWLESILVGNFFVQKKNVKKSVCLKKFCQGISFDQKSFFVKNNAVEEIFGFKKMLIGKKDDYFFWIEKNFELKNTLVLWGLCHLVG